MPRRRAASEKLPAATTSANTTIAEAFSRDPSFLMCKDHIRLCALWNGSIPPIVWIARPYGVSAVGNSSNPIRFDRRSRCWAAAALLLACAAAASADMEGPRWVTRTNPEYPVDALYRGVEGSVVLEYTVDERGRVVKPRILESAPHGVFDRAALRALSTWRYEPPDAPQTMKVRLTFRR
jgi:periplasmic protein TonB